VIWLVQMAQVVGFGLVFLFSRHIQLARVLKAPAEVEEGLEEEEAEYRREEQGPPAGATSERR